MRPELNVRPRRDGPPQLSKARVGAEANEWVKFGQHLLGDGVCGTLKRGGLVERQGSVLFSKSKLI